MQRRPLPSLLYSLSISLLTFFCFLAFFRNPQCGTLGQSEGAIRTVIRIPSESAAVPRAETAATTAMEATPLRSGTSSRGERLLPEIPRSAAAAGTMESRNFADHLRLTGGTAGLLLDSGGLDRKTLQIREEMQF